VTYRLYAPGTRKSPYWMVRGTMDGHKFEVSCRTTDPIEADHFARTFITNLKADLDRHAPKAKSIGPFEQSLLHNYYWHGGKIFHKRGGVLSFYKAAHGYRSTKVVFDGEKRTVLEHRMVFLLVHRWLPESIDHINRDRADNSPSNLQASTPRAQGKNRGKFRTRVAQVVELQ
jgi:hypothetical protein